MRRASALLLSLCAPFAVLAATPEEEVQHYIAIFDGAGDGDKAADDLAWKGISDTRLFDVIEKRLLQDAQGNGRDRTARNHAARLIKALGFSGQPKYAQTLDSLNVEYRRAVER